MTVLRRLDIEGIALLDVGLRRPTLDDVFLTLTGHALDPPDDGQPGQDLALTTMANEELV